MPDNIKSIYEIYPIRLLKNTPEDLAIRMKYYDDKRWNEFTINRISHHCIEIYASYNELCNILGKPTFIKSDYKTYADWVFTFTTKDLKPEIIQPRMMTIYDYKDAYYEDGKMLNEDSFKKSRIYWHLGHGDCDILFVQQIAEEIRNRLKSLRIIPNLNNIIE